MRQVFNIEPLSVQAYVSAILSAASAGGRGWVIDVGMNMGWYTVLGAAMLPPNHRILGVDMQPQCAEVTECALMLNNLSLTHTTVINRYVSSWHGPVIMVPAQACDTMASPTAGRHAPRDGTKHAQTI